MTSGSLVIAKSLTISFSTSAAVLMYTLYSPYYIAHWHVQQVLRIAHWQLPVLNSMHAPCCHCQSYTPIPTPSLTSDYHSIHSVDLHILIFVLWPSCTGLLTATLSQPQHRWRCSSQHEICLLHIVTAVCTRCTECCQSRQIYYQQQVLQ